MNEKELFRTIPSYPSQVNAPAAIARMVDGLGFRYRWSLESLDDNFLEYRPSPDSMNVKEQLVHIHFLASRLYACFIEEKDIPLRSASLHAIKDETLDILFAVRERLLTMNDEALSRCKVVRKANNAVFPFWNFINGPLADALTHVGQINSWRRLAGYPPVKADVFTGQPPLQT